MERDLPEGLSTAEAIDWLRRQNEGWADLFKVSRYATSARLSMETALARWPLLAAAVAVFIALLWLRSRIPAQQQR